MKLHTRGRIPRISHIRIIFYRVLTTVRVQLTKLLYFYGSKIYILAETEIVYPKNAGASVAMNFT